MRNSVCCLFGLVLCTSLAAAEEIRSHPPLRPLPEASDRELPPGSTYFVDTAQGDDLQNGSKDQPWQSISHALKQLSAGDTLCLRGGTYYERVYCAVAGTANKPITIRGYPGEVAIIDGGYREFFANPDAAWEPVPGGAAGEFQSRASFKNLRNVHGYFGDSMIGLQVYYYIEDLRGERYVGPGLWYNGATGRIHARLAHYTPTGEIGTRTPLTLKYLPHRLHKLESYAGETDPRKLPLAIAPFDAVPLLIDGAQHVRFQDLVVRGGGHDVVIIRHGQTVEFDNCIIYAGTYGLNARNTGPLRFTNSAIRGSVPPWSTRGETSLREYPWRLEAKNLTRLNTHALLIPSSGDEYSVYYYPYNQQWEISHSEFTDAHDGVYLGDIDGLKFHHNYVHNLQDDGVYLSSFRGMHQPQHGPREVFQNVISGCLMAFAFGGDGHLTTDVHVYRNIIDASTSVADHGGPPWEGMRWYHNTLLANPKFLFYLSHIKPGQQWQVFNNLVLLGKQTEGKSQDGAAFGGNVAIDPEFATPEDFRLPPGSAAIDAGVDLPSDWPDPLRTEDKGAPDAGAIPLGKESLKVGRHGRLSF